MTFVYWYFALIYIEGAFFVSRNEQVGFKYWFVASIFLTFICYVRGDFLEMFAFLALFFISINGLSMWPKK